MPRIPTVSSVACLLVAVAGGRAADPPDWTKFHASGSVDGVVVKADADGVTIRVPKLEVKQAGGRNRRPSVKVGFEDIDLSYAGGGYVRWQKVPPKTDGTTHTAAELEALRKPAGAKGYAADRSDVKAGHVVHVVLVHPSDVRDSKLTAADVVIKTLMIEGETEPPPGKSDAKKK